MDLIPIRPTSDNYNQNQSLIPVRSTIDGYNQNLSLIPIRKHASSIQRKIQGFLNQKPWLASFSGVLDLPPLLKDLAPSLLLPAQFGMVANSIGQGLNDPTPQKMAFTAIKMAPMVVKRRAQKKIWIDKQQEIREKAKDEDMSGLSRFIQFGEYKSFYLNENEKINIKNAPLMPKGGYNELIKNVTNKYNYNLKYIEQPKATSQNPLTSQTRSITLWKHLNGQQFTYDPMTFQIQSHTKNIIQEQYDESLGDIIKFSIHDVNRKQTLITPAFIQSLQDQGLSGNWQQVQYVNGTYPRFLYKNTSKRTIAFTLKLACFSKNYLQYYVNKLNFLRRVGSPYYAKAQINEYSFQYPKAPIYKMTLGDILVNQYGYFQACNLSWDDQTSLWNLDQNKLWKINENTELDYPVEYQLPIMTNVQINFVCMYGTIPEDTFIKGNI